MADKEFTTTEEVASYGIGMQMGQQLSSAFNGVSLDAALSGIQDAFTGKPPQVNPEEINKAFQVMQERIKAETTQNEERYAAEGIAFLEQNAIRDEVMVTESGLQYEVITSGEGDVPTATSSRERH